MLSIDFDMNTHPCRYGVLIAERLDEFSDALCSAAKEKKLLVLTDTGVAASHLARLEALLGETGTGYEKLILSGGEGEKSLDSLKTVLSFLIEKGFSRNDAILNLGGGVIGDLGGFAAAVYMRGISYINMPTTLLSMVDSSMGGKTGIDLGSVKNAVGAFHQPKLVLCCCDFLDTLPKRELISGFGEVLKYYCLSGSERIKSALLHMKASPLLIEECCAIKREHVLEDVRDGGRRRLLNLGHTFGHAFEGASRFELSHGEAVAMGLIAACRFGEELGIVRSGVCNEVDSLARGFGAKTDYRPYANKAASLLLHDKKRDTDSIEMAFIESFGRPFLRRVPLSAAARFLLDQGA